MTLFSDYITKRSRPMENYNDEFLSILHHYQGIIHKVNLIYFRNDEDRKDNFQEIVLQLWKSYPGLKDKSKLGSWIYKIAINTSISKIRIDSRMVREEKIPEQVNDPATEADRKEEFDLLIDAIHQLNEIDKTIMLLYLEEMDYKEIAEIIGISPIHVGVRINRAKKALKKYFNF